MPSARDATVLSQHEFEGGAVTLTRHLGSLELRPHSHENAAVTFVAAGRMVETTPTMDFVARPWTTFFKPAGARHANRYGREGAYTLIVEFDQVWLRDRVGRQHRPVLLGETGSAVALALLHRLKKKDPDLSPIAEELARELVDASGELSGDPPSWLERGLRGLAEEWRKGISLRDLAAEAAVHPVHFARVFRSHMGCSVGDFIRHRRLEEAVKLLRSSGESIATVAFQCGFYDQPALTNAMRKQTTLTPGALRRLVRILPLLSRSGHS